MTNEEKASRHLEALRLIDMAKALLETGEAPHATIWRLVDAAGLVAETLTDEARFKLIGLEQATGRGYRLARTGRST